MSALLSVRSALRRVLLAQSWLRRPVIRYCVDNHMLPAVLVRTPSRVLRSLMCLPEYQFESELNQDIFALLINRFQAGYFVDVGANDGYALSNTVYLEEKFGWRGVLIEPNPRYASALAGRKGSIHVNKAVAPRQGAAEFVDAGLYGGLRPSLDSRHAARRNDSATFMVECERLGEILDEAGTPTRVDFVSIDIEGQEVSVVRQLVENRRRFRCGCIEHNFRQADLDEICGLLTSAGYKPIWEQQTNQDIFFVDATWDRSCARGMDGAQSS